MDLSGYEIKIEYPEIHIGTAEAYAGVTPELSNVDLRKIDVTQINNWKNWIKNDFEDSIFPNHPEVKKLKEDFYRNGAVYSSMTGSGSAVFGIFKKK